MIVGAQLYRRVDVDLDCSITTDNGDAYDRDYAYTIAEHKPARGKIVYAACSVKFDRAFMRQISRSN